MRNEEWEAVKKLQEINKQDEELRGLNFSKIGAQEEQPKKKQKSAKEEPKEKEKKYPNPPGSRAGALIHGIGCFTLIISIFMFVNEIVSTPRGQSATLWPSLSVFGSSLIIICVGAITSNIADHLVTSQKMLDELKALNKKLDE